MTLYLVRDSFEQPLHAPSPVLAAGLSLLVPGAGQVYTGKIVSAILWFLVVSAGYSHFLLGFMLHLLCIASAARAASSESRQLAT